MALRSPAVGVRLRAYGAAVLVLALVLVAPLVLDRDSFPLSTYPMFSSRRTTTEVVDTAVVVRPGAAEPDRLSPALIGGTDEVILAAATVSDAIRRGPAALAALCTEIAGRVAVRAPADATEVLLVTERFDAVAWFGGDRRPLERRIHHRCEVR